DREESSGQSVRAACSKFQDELCGTLRGEVEAFIEDAAEPGNPLLPIWGIERVLRHGAANSAWGHGKHCNAVRFCLRSDNFGETNECRFAGSVDGQIGKWRRTGDDVNDPAGLTRNHSGQYRARANGRPAQINIDRAPPFRKIRLAKWANWCDAGCVVD